MMSRCFTHLILAFVALCTSCDCVIAKGEELAGPPATVPNSVVEEQPRKSSAAKLEALPLGKPKEVKAAPKESEKAGQSLLDPGTLTTLGALVTVLSVIGTVAYFARKAAQKSGGLWAAMGAGGRAPSGILEVLGRYPVGRGCTLVLLKLDRRILLVSQSSGGKLGGVTMTTLCEVDEAEDVASILLKSQDAETEQSRRKFEHMLTAEDKAYAKHGEIPIEPVPVPLRNVKRTTAGAGSAAAASKMSPLQARLANIRGRSQFEVQG